MLSSATRRIVLRGQRHLRAPGVVSIQQLSLSRNNISLASASVSFPSIHQEDVHQPSSYHHPLSQSCNMSTIATTASHEDDIDENSDSSNANAPLFTSIPTLHPSSLHAITQKMKLSNMTEIQHKTFEAASSGRDILGRARTGTGKTLAFLLPAIENALRLGRVPGPHGRNGEANGGVAILILSPTRELAMQIHNQAQVLVSSHANSSESQHRMASQVMYGGSPRRVDLQKMEDNAPFILTATPGRLIDHMQSSYVNGVPFSEMIANVSVWVLDEADRCLDMGFRNDMEYILGHKQKNNGQGEMNNQTLLFSATLPKDLRKIMASHMRKDYLTVDCVHDVDPASHTNANVDQSYVTLPTTTEDNNGKYISGLVDIIDDIINIQNPELYKLVVFFPTSASCSFFAHLFNDIYRIPTMEIHSKKSQVNRTKTSDRFRKFKKGILFTTDVSARGVDYPNVTHVIQYGSAENRETYIHRLGRTGRANKVGRGIIICHTSSEERQFVNKELKGLDVKLDERYQSLLNGEMVAQDGDGGGGVNGYNSRQQINTERLAKIQHAVGSNGDGGTLTKLASTSYRSLLGYNVSKMQNLGLKYKEEVVEYCNLLAVQTGFTNEMPRISPKTVQNMGLRGVQGINVGMDRVDDSGGGYGGRGGGGGRGGYGGRGGGGRGGGYGGGGGGGRGAWGGERRGGGGGRGGGSRDRYEEQGGFGGANGRDSYDNGNYKEDRTNRGYGGRDAGRGGGGGERRGGGQSGDFQQFDDYRFDSYEN